MADLGKMLLGGVALPAIEKMDSALTSGALGILPAIAKDMRDEAARDKKKKRDAAGREVPVAAGEAGMKKGGSVKAKSKVTRGDGICKKGHTKGKMV